MINLRRDRREYDSIPSTGDVEAPASAVTTTTTTTVSTTEPYNATTTDRTGSTSSASSQRPNNRPYNRVAINDDGDEEDKEENEEINKTSVGNDDDDNENEDETKKDGGKGENVGKSSNNKDGLNEKNDNDIDDGPRITVVVLDFAHKRFKIDASPAWTIAKFKAAGSKVHKVAPSLQRLIFRGRLLADTDTLEGSGITENEVIVHLFPKPRVVIASTASSTTTNQTSDSDNSNNNSGEEEEGARVPTIVMNPEEAERRSQILVLGSEEFVDVQNNVKLFSFMLLIICSIELLNLLSVAIGAPQEENGGMSVNHDDYFPSDGGQSDNYGGTANQVNNPGLEVYEKWGPVNYGDILVSMMGVMVAFTGLRATNENTLKLARYYLIGTFCTGCGWLIVNYFFSIEVDKQEERDEANSTHSGSHHFPMDDDKNNSNKPNWEPSSNYEEDDDMYDQAFRILLVPAMVWFMCCFRAWQFHNLIWEAEREASGRIQSQLDLEEANTNDDSGRGSNAAPSQRNANHLRATTEELGVFT